MTSLLKRFVPRTLMGRALLIVVGPFLIMQVLSAYVFYDGHWDQVSKQLAQGLAGDIVVLVEAMDGLHDPKSRKWLMDAAHKHMDIVTTFDFGAILPNNSREVTDIEGELTRALRYRNLTLPLRVDSTSDRSFITVSVQEPDGVLHFKAPRALLFSWTTYLFVLWMAGTSLFLLGVATIFMRNQVRPVRRLARAADAFGKGRDVPEFKPEGAREVRQAAFAFMAMRNRIQRQITQRTTMLAGVSHDLRTPLTRMKLELEMMPTSEDVSALKEDISEMERMLEGYLAFARGEGSEKPEDSDLGELLQDAVRMARRKGGTVALSTEGDLRLPLRPDAVRRCLTNVIENALRYARHVAVAARRLNNAIEVIIDDDGPGIPTALREEVFKPFLRLESSRNPGTGGVGLGLTIARDVARGHGGEIYLDDSPTGGLRVRVRLPI